MPTSAPRFSTVVYLPPLTAPVNLTVPVISGSLTSGQTITASEGTWTGTHLTYAYEWSVGGVVQSEDTASLLLTDPMIGETVVVTVTATNVEGFASASSAESAAIGAGLGTAGQPVGLLLLLTRAA